MDKIERLISIIMILLKKDIVSTTEFTQLFSVSKRTILRDMETLSVSNIPIYAVQGVNGGYGIMEEYKWDKRLLTSSDLENILTALSGLEQLFLSEEIEVTIRKIEAMVSPLSLKGSVQLSYYDWEGRSELLDTLKTCQDAIFKSRLIVFDYIDKDGVRTNRVVEPEQLHFSESSWYLKGFCLERRGHRTFKISRIDHLQMDNRTFTPRGNSQQERKASYEPQLVAVKALIAPGIKDQLIERYGRKSVEDYSPEAYLATIHVPQNSIGYQFLAGFGTNLKVVEPNTYVEDFKHYIYQMMENYG